MNFKEVKSLMSLLDNSDLTEIEWKFNDNHIILKKEKEVVHTVSQAAPVAMAATPTAVVAPLGSAVDTATPVIESGLAIKSPMVGTYYAKPSPDSEPYLKVGDKVSKGQVVCIIEAMKLMNEVESDIDGTVVEVCISDATPVEYDGVLFKVAP
ncbi:MAG: acetyl-CoA carboxylase biotin carboxyl carrier protein [Fibrobacterales bacterium]